MVKMVQKIQSVLNVHCFYKKLRDRYITLVKAEEKQKEFKSDLNQILKGGNKSEKQKSTLKKIKELSESREKVIKLFNDYSKIASKARYRSVYGERLKILTPKQMLQILPIALVQVKAGSTSEKLLNNITDKSYISCIEKKKLLKSIQQYNEFNKVIKQNGYYIYKF